jgi:hypothetical protein
MTTCANTDFVFNAAPVGDTDPYTITGAALIAADEAVNNTQILSGSLCNSETTGGGTDVVFRVRKSGTATATTLRASCEMTGGGSYNRKGPCMLAADGAGIGLFVSDNAFFHVLEWNAAGTVGTIHFEDEEPTTLVNGDRIHMEFDTATGIMRFYKEATQLTSLNLTDTSFNATAMMPGWAIYGADADMAGWTSIGADYLSGGGGGGGNFVGGMIVQVTRRIAG